jgi:hypothetical protein
MQEEMKVTFNPSLDKQRVKGEEFRIVDPLGMPHLWKPEFHVSGFTHLRKMAVLILAFAVPGGSG